MTELVEKKSCSYCGMSVSHPISLIMLISVNNYQILWGALLWLIMLDNTPWSYGDFFFFSTYSLRTYSYHMKIK